MKQFISALLTIVALVYGAYALYNNYNVVRYDQKFDDADELYDKGDYEGAIKIYTEAIEHNKNTKKIDFAVYNNRGNAYAAMGNYTAAIDDYNQALQYFKEGDAGKGRSKSSIYNNLGICYQELGNYTKAEEYFAKAK